MPHVDSSIEMVSGIENYGKQNSRSFGFISLFADVMLIL